MRNRKRVVVADDAANLALDARGNVSRINHEALLAYATGWGQWCRRVSTIHVTTAWNGIAAK